MLPAHRRTILNLKNYLQEEEPATDYVRTADFSSSLKTLIETANRNVNKIPTQYRYCDIIRYFCVYIYLTRGKMCYETLCRNLPLPQPSSIRMLMFKFNKQ